MSRARPFIRETKPEDMLCKVVPCGLGQFSIENNYRGIEDWDREYVGFSGYFGTHGPHVFAAAPELLAAAVDLESLCAWLLHRFGPDSLEGRESGFRAMKARAAIAKATGQ